MSEKAYGTLNMELTFNIRGDLSSCLRNSYGASHAVIVIFVLRNLWVWRQYLSSMILKYFLQFVIIIQFFSRGRLFSNNFKNY